MADARPLLTPEDVAQLFGVPLQTVYSWRSTRRGSGPIGFRVGRHVRYTQDECDRFIEQQMAKAAA